MIFHGCNSAVFFTGRHNFSRVVSETFSRGESTFHGSKTENFHERRFFFTGKKALTPGVTKQRNISDENFKKRQRTTYVTMFEPVHSKAARKGRA